MWYLSICLCVLLPSLAVLAEAGAEQIRSMTKSIPRETFKKLHKSDGSVMHEVVIAVKQQNIPQLEAIVLDRSSPFSDQYRKWLSNEEVAEMTRNEQATAAVEQWLAANNIEMSWKSAHGEYLKATATIEVWDRLLNAQFNLFEDHLSKNKAARVHRSDEYTIPEALQQHVFTIFNTVQTPPIINGRYYPADRTPIVPPSTVTPPSLRGKGSKMRTKSSDVTVDFLNNLYHIESNIGRASQKQSVFETNNEMFSPTDLADFQSTYSLTSQAAEDPFSQSTNDCASNSCFEGNLDVQYIMGVAQETETVFWYVSATGDPFVDYLTAITTSTDPPMVNSISWGAIEQANPVDSMEAFNTEALKIAAQGGTILVSSGDNGVASHPNLCNTPSGSSQSHWTGASWSGQGYFPSYPATSPYVTAVGATMGPESGDPEVACQSQEGGVITTGGGFSTYYATPSWQQDAVDAYFASLSGSEVPTSGYNRNGRGYPDISLIGVNYQVVVDGSLQSLYGTSASAPVFAAMISLINADRVANNLTTVGFLNPTIYAYGAHNTFGTGGTNFNPFTDVTQGHNQCCSSGDAASAVCCNSGFVSAEKWDPVTGWGSTLFPDLAQMLAVEVNYTGNNGNDDNGGSAGAAAISLLVLIIIIVVGSLIVCAILSCLINFLCFPCRSSYAV